MSLVTTNAQPPAKAPISDDPWPDGRIGVGILILFFGLFLGWAAFVPLDAGVYAQGFVKVSGNRTTVQHRDGGVVAHVAVREGNHVTAGQVLLDLSATELVANERAISGQTLELEALRARLTAEAYNQDSIIPPDRWKTLEGNDVPLSQSILAREEAERATRAEALAAQISVLSEREQQLQARIAGYQAQIAAINKQSKLTSDQLAGLQELQAKGYASLNRVRDVQRALADNERQRAQLTSATAEANEAIGEVHMQQISAKQDRAQQIANDIRQTESQLAEALPKLNAAKSQLERARVRAPVSGTVVALAFFNPGAVVRPGDRILDIVPDRQPLVIEAQIKPQDADDVHSGMPTMVRLSAFEGRNLLKARGTVKEISADRLHDDRTGISYFIANVEVTPEEIQRIATASGRKNLALSPGLPAEIVVPLRKRTALQYLIEPLNQTLWRSFREH